MQETTAHPTLAPEAPDGLAASALQAEGWAGEPFLHPDEDPAVVLAPHTARRRALDDALAEIYFGRSAESQHVFEANYNINFGDRRKWLAFAFDKELNISRLSLQSSNS